MLIAQITDTHIVERGHLYKGRIDTADWLSKAVRSINRLEPQPDVVVLTGDCVDDGTAAQYDHLGEVLAALRAPLLAVPGNHDRRNLFLDTFPQIAARIGDFPFVQYAVEDFPVRLVALDTLDEGFPGGRLCETRLRWVDETLASGRDRSTLIFMHHPPFVTGIPKMDAQALAQPRALTAILGRYPSVERILAGHLHRPIEARVAHAIAATAPSTAHQVSLGFDARQSFGFTTEQPGYRLLLWHEETGFVSHLATHAPFEGPFSWDDGAALPGS